MELIEAKFGSAFNLFDRKPRCPTCGTPGHFMFSAGPSTPFRPMTTGMH